MPQARFSPAFILHGRFASLACCLALSLATAPASAQWVVTTRRVEERSKDDHIILKVDLPVLTGDANPAARKAINHALGLASDVDKLQEEAEEAIRRHNATLHGKKLSQDEQGEDLSDEHTIGYEVGLNDGHIFSLCLKGYWLPGGGGSGTPYATGRTFSAETGRALVLDDLFATGWQKPLRELMKRTLKGQPYDLFPDWATSLEKAPFEFWLSKDGLEISFPKYSLAPGSSGVVSILISYEDLRPLIPKGGRLVAYLK